jgi:hypothetical protein
MDLVVVVEEQLDTAILVRKAHQAQAEREAQGLSTSTTNEDHKMYAVVGDDNWVVNACLATSLKDCEETFPGKNYTYIEITSQTGPGYFPGYWDGYKIIRGDSIELLSLRGN